jgi:nucleoid-associated protein YgaU
MMRVSTRPVLAASILAASAVIAIPALAFEGAIGLSTAPSLSRVVIGSNGASTLEGWGRPGTHVVVRRDGLEVAAAHVGKTGRWSVGLSNEVTVGDHRYSTGLTLGGRIIPGDEVRISVPQNLPGKTSISSETFGEKTQSAENGNWIALRRRAEDLAFAASKEFTHFTRKSEQRIRLAQAETGGENKTGAETTPAATDFFSRVANWLEHAAEAYQSDIVGPLSVPAPSNIEPDGARESKGRTDQSPKERADDEIATKFVEAATSIWKTVEEWWSKAGEFLANKTEDAPAERAAETTNPDAESREPASRAEPAKPTEPAEPAPVEEQLARNELQAQAQDRKAALKADIERRRKENEERFIKGLKVLEEAQKEAAKKKEAEPDNGEADTQRRQKELDEQAKRDKRKAEYQRKRDENERLIRQGLEKLRQLHKAEDEREAAVADTAAEPARAVAERRETEAKARAAEARFAAAEKYMQERRMAEAAREAKRQEIMEAGEKRREFAEARASAVSEYIETRRLAEQERLERERAAAKADATRLAAEKLGEERRLTEANVPVERGAEEENAANATDAAPAAPEKAAAKTPEASNGAKESRKSRALRANPESDQKTSALKEPETRAREPATETGNIDARRRETSGSERRGGAKARPSEDRKTATDLKTARQRDVAAKDDARAPRKASPRRQKYAAAKKAKKRAKRTRKATRTKTWSQRARTRKATRTKTWSKRARARKVRSRGKCRKRRIRHRRGERVHVVRRGETLWSISRRYLKRGRRYKAIYRANRRRVRSPDYIYPCQHLIIPKRTRRRR